MKRFIICAMQENGTEIPIETMQKLQECIDNGTKIIKKDLWKIKRDISQVRKASVCKAEYA